MLWTSVLDGLMFGIAIGAALSVIYVLLRRGGGS